MVVTMLWHEYKAYQESEAHSLYGTPRGELSSVEMTNIGIYKKSNVTLGWGRPTGSKIS